MIKRIIGALFIIIVFSVIVALFTSFGMAQNANDGHAVELLLPPLWCSDQGPDPPLVNNEEMKDVAWCEGQVLDDLDEEPYDIYTDHFAFSIHDGYPGYECTLNLIVHNVGTEPLEITSTSVTSTHPHVSVSGVSVSSTDLDPDDGSPGGADEAVVIFTVTVLPDATPGTTYDDVITGSVVVEGVGNG